MPFAEGIIIVTRTVDALYLLLNESNCFVSTGDVLFVLRKGMLLANVGLSLLANRVGGNIMLLFVGAKAPILVSPAMLAAVIVMSLSMPALLCMWVPQVG